jgi:hypothetical protein
MKKGASETKIETATRRKIKVIDTMLAALPAPWEMPLEEPENLGVYVKDRAYKDNPDHRDSGYIGFTWKGPLINTETGYTTQKFNIEADFKPTQMVEHSMKKLQFKMPVHGGGRPTMPICLNHFSKNRIMIQTWGTEKGEDIIIKQMAIIPMFMLKPNEIYIRDNQDKHQIAYDAERLLAKKPYPGWQDVDLKKKRFNVTGNSVPLEIYILERLLWIAKYV